MVAATAAYIVEWTCSLKLGIDTRPFCCGVGTMGYVPSLRTVE
jgi:hypothetical protein